MARTLPTFSFLCLLLNVACTPAPESASDGAATAPPRDDETADQEPAQSRPLEHVYVEWRHYGGNLASHRYSPLDQINRDNVKDLRVEWSYATGNFGPRP
jgi:glucose dehydrogenase